MKKYLALILLLALAAIFAACGDTPSANTTQTSNPNDTPTEAYKRLFAAVKSKNTEAIKAEFSKKSIAAAQAQAARGKIPVDEVFKNGFTATTFAETLPEMRDERVNGTMGALEVWNSKDSKWEDLPFVREDSGWKLAVGDMFAGSWKSPGRGRDAKEREAANAASGNATKIVNSNVNFNRSIPNANANVNVRK
ncbi:MAG TPA: hypothetical protein PLK77_03830 [Pyrinomonadaceae bacterium]|nr:hypothetical protein [Pyrinomonadaceae bacterium]